MASRDGSRTRGRGRRQTRSGRASASDEDDFAEQTPTVKRTTRRTSIITVEPQGQPENGVENVSVLEVQKEQVRSHLKSHQNLQRGRHTCGMHFVQHPQALRNMHHIVDKTISVRDGRGLTGTRRCVKP